MSVTMERYALHRYLKYISMGIAWDDAPTVHCEWVIDKSLDLARSDQMQRTVCDQRFADPFVKQQ